MPDAIDQIQDMTDRHLANAVRTHARAQASRRPGLTHCEQDDCRLPIAALRQEMGARLCIECATADEARNAHQAAWRHRLPMRCTRRYWPRAGRKAASPGTLAQLQAMRAEALAPVTSQRTPEELLAELEQRRVDATCTRQLPLRSRTTD